MGWIVFVNPSVTSFNFFSLSSREPRRPLIWTCAPCTLVSKAQFVFYWHRLLHIGLYHSLNFTLVQCKQKCRLNELYVFTVQKKKWAVCNHGSWSKMVNRHFKHNNHFLTNPSPRDISEECALYKFPQNTYLWLFFISFH